MALHDDRLQYLIKAKDDLELATQDEGWAIIDGALVIYDLDDPPAWLPHNWERDEDGDTRPEILQRMEQQAEQRASDMEQIRAQAGL